MMNRKERNTQTFATKTKKTNRKLGCTLCANVPKIYPKWQNGIPQMVFWGMRKRGSRHQNKSAEVEFWGVEGREMGFIGLVTRPKLGETGKKYNPFLQFSGHGNGIIIR